MNQSKIIICSLLLLSISVQAQITSSDKEFLKWAPTPPMGWNSWDCFGPTVVESEVRANADFMSANLKSFGWEYVVVDIRWFVANDKSGGYNQKDPLYSMDQYGRFIPAVNRFPSAADGKGFKPLADYIHSKGLKFGIHIMRGIPVEAVKANLPILGSTAKAQDIYTDKEQCTWLKDMYGIVAGKEGSQEYYNSILKLYAAWGVDFIKVDDLTSPIYHQAEVEMIRKAIDLSGRKIVFSTSPGETPIAHVNHVKEHANMWRTVGDFWDNWPQLKEHFEVFKRWSPYIASGGGAWPDGDMLPMGHIIRAERGPERMSAFTKDELVTMMTLWSIFRSPMMFGGHLPDTDPFSLSLLQNKEVLGVHQSSSNNRPLFNLNGAVAWTADDPKTGDKYLAVFNAADPAPIFEEKAFWNSGIVDKSTPGQSKSIDLDISGTKKLYLAVTDGGDGSAWDFANWISPVAYKGSDSLVLTPVQRRGGRGGMRRNTSATGSKLIVDGKEYLTGFGVNPNSIIEFDIPEGYTRFKTLAGLDNAAVAQNTGATVKFLIFKEDPTGPTPPVSMKIPVQLKDLGLTAPAFKIRDMWAAKDLGTFSTEFAPEIMRHGGGMYRISPQK